MAKALGTTVTAETPAFDYWADGTGIPPGAVREGPKVMTGR
jgi:hypothetical protein